VVADNPFALEIVEWLKVKPKKPQTHRRFPKGGGEHSARKRNFKRR
jgi:hypothetical protein